MIKQKISYVVNTKPVLKRILEILPPPEFAPQINDCMLSRNGSIVALHLIVFTELKEVALEGILIVKLQATV